MKKFLAPIFAAILSLGNCSPLQRIPGNGGDSNDFVDMCTTRECIGTSYRILKAMNDSVNPCENFYEVRMSRYRQMYWYKLFNCIDKMQSSIFSPSGQFLETSVTSWLFYIWNIWPFTKICPKFAKVGSKCWQMPIKPSKIAEGQKFCQICLHCLKPKLFFSIYRPLLLFVEPIC